jgi:hypothetical protein
LDETSTLDVEDMSADRGTQVQCVRPAGRELGKLSFSTSCDPKMQAVFERGVAMIHSYWFTIARGTFEGVFR